MMQSPTTSPPLRRKPDMQDVFVAAWRAHRRHFWRGLGCLVVALAAIAGTLILALTGVLYCLMEASGIPYRGRYSWVPSFAVITLLWLWWAFVKWPIWSAYQWAIVRCFDGRRPGLRQLLHGYRQPFNVLARLGLWETLGYGLLIFLPGVALERGAAVVDAGRGAEGTFACLAVALLSSGFLLAGVTVIEGAIFLASQLTFARDAPQVADVFRENWRAIRAWPRGFLSLALLTTALWAVPCLCQCPIAIGSQPADPSARSWPAWVCIAILLLLCLVWMWLLHYSAFLKAAFFRAAYGYPLDQPPAGAPPPAGEAAAPSEQGDGP